MMLLKNIFFVVILLNVQILYGQSNKQLDKLIESISIIDQVESKHVGYSGSESENYKNFTLLKDLASMEELVQLTDNTNSTVACYASLALADKKYSDIKSIFIKFIENELKVSTQSGCIVSEEKVAIILYDHYRNTVFSTKATDELLMELDSLIIYGKKSYWELLDRALDNRIYSSEYQKRIANLAFEKEQIEAVYYLSNWYKAEYQDKIKSALLKYLNATQFKKVGNHEYFRTVRELYNFKDEKINQAIIVKLKNDRHWEYDRVRLEAIIGSYLMYEIELKAEFKPQMQLLC